MTSFILKSRIVSFLGPCVMAGIALGACGGQTDTPATGGTGGTGSEGASGMNTVGSDAGPGSARDAWAGFTPVDGGSGLSCFTLEMIRSACLPPSSPFGPYCSRGADVWNDEAGSSCPDAIGVSACSGYFGPPVRQGDSCCYRFGMQPPGLC
jgi:hypothetical protein